ncbi:MAG TPA: hypothetical protein VHO84_05995 [Syntrophorhabdaceae bacterium]|nr:hypothetical protein [Syntrophorhabdaceae bacterium]
MGPSTETNAASSPFGCLERWNPEMLILWLPRMVATFPIIPGLSNILKWRKLPSGITSR